MFNATWKPHGFYLSQKTCTCRDSSWYLLSCCLHRKWLPFLKRCWVIFALHFLFVNWLFSKESEQNKVEYSVFEWMSSMLAKTETLKCQEIGKCLHLGRPMRILCLFLIFAFFLLWAAAGFFSSHVYLWNVLGCCCCLLKLLWSKLGCFAETCFIVDSHPVFIYPCSCIAGGGFWSSAAVETGQEGELSSLL